MFAFDQGFLQLSKDEILAGQTLYPGSGGTSTSPPTAVASGSPLTGLAPLNCNLDASASTPGTSPIASYVWNFGDGATANGVSSSHTYTTSGIYSAVVTVIDSTGLSSSTAVTVHVEDPGSPIRGNFKLAFNAIGKDTFTATILSSELGTYHPGTASVNGIVSVAGVNFPFTYDAVKKKALGSTGLKLTVTPKFGTVVITLSKVDLRAALGALGAANATVSGVTVSVPVSVVFGDGSLLALDCPFDFIYSAKVEKSGTGKF